MDGPGKPAPSGRGEEIQRFPERQAACFQGDTLVDKKNVSFIQRPVGLAGDFPEGLQDIHLSGGQVDPRGRFHELQPPQGGQDFLDAAPYFRVNGIHISLNEGLHVGPQFDERPRGFLTNRDVVASEFPDQGADTDAEPPFLRRR